MELIINSGFFFFFSLSDIFSEFVEFGKNEELRSDLSWDAFKLLLVAFGFLLEYNELDKYVSIIDALWSISLFWIGLVDESTGKSFFECLKLF